MFQNPFIATEATDRSCPHCGQPIAISDVNVAADTALCRCCGRSFAFSSILTEEFDLSMAPDGVSIERLPAGFVASASTRTWLAAVLIPFTCVWSGFSLNGIYGTQIRRGVFDPFQSLFGVMFVVGTFILGSHAVMSILGRVTVRQDGDDGAIFVGAGPLGWTRHFRWPDVISVSETDSQSRSRSPHRVLALRIANGGRTRTIRFGLQLPEDRRRYVMAFIRSNLKRSARAV